MPTVVVIWTPSKGASGARGTGVPVRQSASLSTRLRAEVANHDRVCVTTMPTLLAVMLVSLGLVGCGAWEESQKAAAYACVASLQAGLNAEADLYTGLSVNVGPNWLSLPEQESQGLFSRLAGKRALDCGAWKGEGPLVDAWKHALRAALRRASSGSVETRVWSLGPDGIDATGDDISVPESQRVPSPVS